MNTFKLESAVSGTREGELLAVPRTNDELERAAARAKKVVTRRAAVASAASLLPVPGLDLAVDIAAVMNMIPEINREFGLTPEQIEHLSPGRRLLVYKSIIAVGSVMIGKIVTTEIAIAALKAVGVRLTVKQVGKYVPVAGQALAVTLAFGAMTYVGRQHIRDCRRVVEFTLAGGKV